MELTEGTPGGVLLHLSRTCETVAAGGLPRWERRGGLSEQRVCRQADSQSQWGDFLIERPLSDTLTRPFR